MNATDAKRIRAIADRVERINEEIAAMNADKREIFAEARGEGHDVKALKAAIKIRQQKANDSAGFQEHEHLVEMYLNALDSPEETGHARAPAPRTRQISETPAPDFSSADGGLPQPSVPAEPRVSAASTSGSGPAGPTSASEGTQPAEPLTQGVAQPGSAPGLEPGGRRFESSRPDQSDDGLDIPTFMKRDANNRAPWMEGTG